MAVSTKVRIKKVELANSIISTTYGRFKFDANGTARVPIELARELLNSGDGFIVVDDNGNEIELPTEDDTIPGGGDDTITPEPTLPGGDDPTIPPEPIYTIEGGTYTTIDGGYVISDGNDGVYTLIGSDFDSDHISIKDGKLEFIQGINTESVHVMGVEENSTLKIGDVEYKWENSDANLENGLELVSISSGDDTITPDPTIPGGDDTIKPEPTLPGGDDTIKPEPITLSGGGLYSTIDGGFIVQDGVSQYTLTGDTLDTDHISVVDGNIVFSEGINPSSVHIMGVEKDSTIGIGDSVYKFENIDNISGNGLELVLVHDASTITPEPTLPGGDDTITPEPTIPGGDDTITPEPTIPGGENGFSYDFDGKTFTVSGGLEDDLTVDDLNEKAVFDGETLSLDSGIVNDLNSVHVQGLSENSTVNVEGEEFVLQDTDNNPENVLELVGKTSDVYGWVFSNRSSANYESQIWKHTADGVEDIVVVGCVARPSINNNTLTILGEDIKVISNKSRDEISIDSKFITGVLTKGVTWDSEIGIKQGLGTKSYVLANNTLYIPKTYVTNITSSTIDWKLSKGTLTIVDGTLDTSKAIVKGSSVSLVKYQNKTYYVNVKTGKLVANAWQKRK